MKHYNIGDAVNHPVKGQGIIVAIRPCSDRWGQPKKGFVHTIEYKNYKYDNNRDAVTSDYMYVLAVD